jgi:hypothetical protein
VVSRKRDEDQVRQVATAVENLVAEAIKATVEHRSPEPARECVAELLRIDERAAPTDRSGPAQLMATLALVKWAGLVRNELADRPGQVDESLAWIEDALGTRYRARARYLSAALRSDEAASEITAYRRALQDQFLPSFIWLLAGTVAVHGAGKIDWLRQLEWPPVTA